MRRFYSFTGVLFAVHSTSTQEWRCKAPKYREVFRFYKSLRILPQSREALSRKYVDEWKASVLKEVDMNS
jgi:hypothetical protein